MTKTFTAFFIPLLLTQVGLGQRSKPLSHAQAMQVMKACEERRFPECEELSVYNVIQRYRRGDLSLLTPLLRTFTFSDGALTEELDEFYGKELQTRTVRFLTALSRLPVNLRVEISHHIYVDGTRTNMRRLRQRLIRIARKKSSISQVARLCIDAVPTYVRSIDIPSANHK